MRLVDADALMQTYAKFVAPSNNSDFENEPTWNDAVSLLESAPTVDPIKHGQWINKGFEPTRCSVCGITVDAINGIPWANIGFKFCPNCGAKMDEVEDGV